MRNTIRFAAALAVISLAAPVVHANENDKDLVHAFKWLGKKIGKGAKFYVDSFKDQKNSSDGKEFLPPPPAPDESDWSAEDNILNADPENESAASTPPVGIPQEEALNEQGFLATPPPPPPPPPPGLETPDTRPDQSPRESFDAGPILSTQMGLQLNQIAASIPNFPQVSNAVLGSQKFRPSFGPIPWRMLQATNSVKILFIGQDGTHIAEAANRPATAGFGGRAMDLAKYFGVTSGAAFINTYAFTIRGQYGSFDAPVIHKNATGGVDNVTFNSFVDNQLWLVTQDQGSPIVQWRNSLIDWIIRNNRDSLQMIVTFGGAARDAMGAFVIGHRGTVGTRLSSDDLSKIVVPEYALVNAGGNNEEPVPLLKNGQDAYAAIGKVAVDFSKPDQVLAAQKRFGDALKAQPALLQQLQTSRGSGIVDAAQLGGYDIDQKMQVSAQAPVSISLKGLTLSDRTVINRDVLVVQLPHPTALSMMTPQDAAAAVKKKVAGIAKFPQWRIAPDAGQENRFAAGKDYVFARADIGPETYDFGAPASRMVNVSSASRMNQATIVFGTRDKVQFDQAALTAMVNSKPSQFPPANEMWTKAARVATQGAYDPGPPADVAKLMKDKLPLTLVKSPTHVVNTDFGHYRGTWAKPSVVILADPDGFDDLNTGRALTGARGQFLHGLMQDLGVGENYLVIKTAPFSNCEAKDWADTLLQTQAYRDAVLTRALQTRTVRVILTDGPDAANEMKRMARITAAANVKVINIQRTGLANNSGIVDAGKEIAAALGARTQATGKMVDIPRSHLVYYERWWGGKGGDHVITAVPADKENFCASFAVVAPAWATSQVLPLTGTDAQLTQGLIQKEQQLGIVLPQQKRPAFGGRPPAAGAQAAQ